jgi:hypothetical protein
LGEISIRRGRRLPGAGQHLKHLPGQRGTPGKAPELGEQGLARCGSSFEDLRVLAQGRPALADADDRIHGGTAVGGTLREKPGEARRRLLRGLR